LVRTREVSSPAQSHAHRICHVGSLKLLACAPDKLPLLLVVTPPHKRERPQHLFFVELEVFAKNHPLLPRDEPILSDIDGPHYFPEISILQYSVKQLVEMHRGNVHALQLTRLAEEQIWGSIADILKKQQDDTRIDVVISTAWDSEEGGSRRKAKVKPMRIERKYFEVPLYIILRSEDNSGYKDLFDESTIFFPKKPASLFFRRTFLFNPFTRSLRHMLREISMKIDPRRYRR